MAMTKCKECGQPVSTAATACPHCGALRKKKTSVFVWLVLIFIGIPLLIGVFNAAVNGPSALPTAAATSAVTPWKPSDGTYESREVDNGKWQYSNGTDAMRHTVDKSATLISADSEKFDFPYGEARLALVVRQSSKFGSDVYLEIRKGQFTCRFDGCNISMSFNDGKVERFTANEASGGNTDTIFLRVNQAAFVKRLKSAQKLQIEAEYFQEGVRQFTFYPSKLDWS